MTTEAHMDKLGQDLNELSNEAQEMVEATAGETSERISQLRNRLTAALDTAKTTYQKLREKTVAGAKVADKAIRGNPYQSIGIAAGTAFGLGLVVGVLAGRR